MAYGFDAKVVGVTFNNTGSNKENRQSIIRELYLHGNLHPGQELKLVRDPYNPYDCNAVSVIGPDGRQIGNLSKAVAANLSPRMASGQNYRAVVTTVTGGNGYSYGVNIRIEAVEYTPPQATTPYHSVQSQEAQAREDCRKGKALYQQKDYQNALPFLRSAAKAGNAEAQFYYGVCYDFGYGIPKDEETAFEWYLRSAQQGYADAMGNVGFDYHYGSGTQQDYHKALEWYQKAAENGDAHGMVGLGRMYERGEGVRQDDEESYKWYHMAAELGDSDGMNNTGIALLIGRGVDRDPYEAAKWNRKAAELGHAKAQFNLGRQYLQADGVPQDYQEALYWIQQAAINGHPQAMRIVQQSGLM